MQIEKMCRKSYSPSPLNPLLRVGEMLPKAAANVVIVVSPLLNVRDIVQAIFNCHEWPEWHLSLCHL